MKIEEIDMNLKEKYQKKVDAIKELLEKKEYGEEMRKDLENMKDIYEYRLESIENATKEQKAKEARDKQ